MLQQLWAHVRRADQVGNKQERKITKELKSKFLPVLDILFLQIRSLSTLLHSLSQKGGLHGPHRCIPILSGSQVIFISGQHWQEIGGGELGERGQGIYYPISLPAKWLQHSCIPSLKMLIKPFSPLTFGFRGGNSSTASLGQCMILFHSNTPLSQ